MIGRYQDEKNETQRRRSRSLACLASLPPGTDHVSCASLPNRLDLDAASSLVGAAVLGLEKTRWQTPTHRPRGYKEMY